MWHYFGSWGTEACLQGEKLKMVKKSTLTMTSVKEMEFQVFQRERDKHVITCMKELPLVLSDKPYY